MHDITGPGISAAIEKEANHEPYAKLNLKKYKPMAARNEDKKVSSGLL
jgi:hypothetical protein